MEALGLGKEGVSGKNNITSAIKKLFVSKAIDTVGEQSGQNLANALINGLTKSQVSDRLSEIFLLSSQTGITQEMAAQSLGYNLVELQRANIAFRSVSESSVGATKSLSSFFVKANNGTTIIGRLATLLGVSSGGLVAGLGALAIAGVAAYKIWDHFNISVEEATEYMDEWNAKVDESKSKINAQKELVDKAKESYSKLAQGVNTFTNANIDLSDEEYKEFIDLNNELAEQFPSLKTGLDDNNNAIINLGDNALTSAKKLDELLEREERLNAYELRTGASDAYKNTMVLIDDNEENKVDVYQEKVEKLTSKIKDYNEAINNLSADTDTLSLNVTADRNAELKKIYSDAIKNLEEKTGKRIGEDVYGEGQNDEYNEDDVVIGSEFYINLYKLEDSERQLVVNYINDKIGEINGELNTRLTNENDNLEGAKLVSDDYWQKYINDTLSPIMEGDMVYAKMDETGRKMADAMLSGITKEAEINEEDPYAYVQENILANIDELRNMDFVSDSGKKLSFMDLFSGELSNDEMVALYTQIQNYFKDKNIDISFSVGEDAVNINKKFESTNRQILKDDAQGWKEVDEFTQDFTTDQKELWVEVTTGCKSGTEAIEKYKRATEKAADATEKLSDSFNIDNLKSANSALKSANDIYADLVEKQAEGKVGEDLAFDVNDIYPLLDNLKDAEGKSITLDDAELEKFNKLADILTEGTASAEEMKDAVDGISTIFADAILDAGDFDDESKQLVKTQMMLNGITEESAEKYIEYRSALHSLEETMSNIQSLDMTDPVNVSNATNQLIALQGELELTDEQFGQFIQLMILSGSISITGDNTWLYELAEACNLPIEKLKEVIALKSQASGGLLVNSYSTGTASGTVKDDKGSIHTTYGSTSSYVQGAKGKVEQEKKNLQETLGGVFNDNGLRNTAKKAGSGAGDAYKDGLEDSLSDMNSVLSYINNIIGDQIDLLNDQKDAAIDALEAEKEAAEEALQAQIDAIQDKIDAKQKEIDAIKEANEQREREMALQKAQYQLQKMLNQRTILIYSESRGMHYETDQTGIREAKAELDNQKDEIRIAAMEKEIQAWEEEIEDLQKKIEESNEYYDKLIEQTEAYYDALIKGLEEYRSRWEELGEIEEQAKMQAKLKELGISVDDITNMSEDAFNKFKSDYLGILTEMYSGESDVLAEINSLAGDIDMSPMQEGLDKTKKNIDELAGADYDSVKNGFEGISDSAEKATSAINGNGEGSGLSSGVDKLNDLSNVDLSNINSGVETLTQNINLLSDAISGGEEGNGIASALSDIQNMTFETPIGSLEEMTNAIESVNTALGIGQGTNFSGEGANGMPSDVAQKQDKKNAEGGTGLISGLQQVNETSLEDITSQFRDNLLPAITDTTTAIGAGGEEGNGESGGGDMPADGNSLMGSIAIMSETAPGYVEMVTSAFSELLSVISSCVTGLQQMNNLMNGSNWKGSTAGMPSNLYSGTAYASGNWSAKSKGISGTSLVGELGTEIRVDTKTGRWETIGENGAEFTKINPGDIVFNHKQSVELLKNGKINSRGKAYAGGRLPDNLVPLENKGIEVATLLSSIKDVNPLMQKLNANVETISKNINYINNSGAKSQEINQTFHISMPNVNDSTSAMTLMKDLQTLSMKKIQFF